MVFHFLSCFLEQNNRVHCEMFCYLRTKQILSVFNYLVFLTENKVCVLVYYIYICNNIDELLLVFINSILSNVAIYWYILFNIGTSWRCTLRSKKLYCKATVFQPAGTSDFLPGPHHHIHQPVVSYKHRFNNHCILIKYSIDLCHLFY